MSKVGLNSAVAGAQGARKALSSIKVQTAPVHVGDSSYEELIPEDAVDITVGVYFDGTQNNRKNTEAREEYEKGALGDKSTAENYIFEKGSSFENDHSNISRGEPYYTSRSEEKHKQFSIYVEGAGTENHKKDSWFLGVAQGRGDTGVLAKVKKACEEAASKINKQIEGINVETINRLTIDTFGFSRGAASARNFVHEITQREGAVKEVIYPPSYGYGVAEPIEINYEYDYGHLGEELVKFGWEVKILRIRFVGLYDTVASFGINHDSDTQELNLDAIIRASHVFQIGADDEHRNNFRRTNIKSAGSKGKEVLFPGVHSDIGGGYLNGAGEKLVVDKYYIPRLKEERRYLIEQGWYNDHEIHVDQGWAKLRAERTSISNRYSYIPLQSMTDYCMAHKVECEIGSLKTKYKIEGQDLIDVQKKLDNYVWGNRGKVSFFNTEDKELLKRLRHDYFHFSAHYKKAYGFLPNKPNRVDGERARQINEG